MFSIGGNVGIVEPGYTVNFNTDTMFDLMSGSFVRGYDGKFVCNGGLSASLMGTCGRSNTYKSTWTASLMMRAASIYDTQVYIADSEDSISRSIERILRFAGNHSSKLTPEYVVALDATTEYDLAKLLATIQEIGEAKLAMKKEAIITTPFLDPKTNERVKTLVPTFLFIDSLTECHSTAEDKMITDLGLDDAKVKTAYMADSNGKTLFLRQAKRFAAKYGIELVMTAHYGTKLNLDPYAAAAQKSMPWMKADEAAKGVGSKFYFLTAVQALITGATRVVDDAKQAKYKLTPQTSPTDLNEITVLMQRCKGNASGLTHPFVVSQESGLLQDVSDYHYLRAYAKGFSMSGNNVTHQSMFLPDVNMTRNSFRGICQKDPRLAKALQLGAQLYYIQTNWNDAGFTFPIKVEPAKLVEAILSDKNKMSMDRILNSRSYWLPDEIKDDKEYMSILDILEFVHMNKLMKE